MSIAGAGVITEADIGNGVEYVSWTLWSDGCTGPKLQPVLAERIPLSNARYMFASNHQWAVPGLVPWNTLATSFATGECYHVCVQLTGATRVKIPCQRAREMTVTNTFLLVSYSRHLYCFRAGKTIIEIMCLGFYS